MVTKIFIGFVAVVAVVNLLFVIGIHSKPTERRIAEIVSSQQPVVDRHQKELDQWARDVAAGKYDESPAEEAERFAHDRCARFADDPMAHMRCFLLTGIVMLIFHPC